MKKVMKSRNGRYAAEMAAWKGTEIAKSEDIWETTESSV